ncbi:MAG: Tetraacyldisaccharide 4'-kinase [Syntrophorhabdaceae bacterium PtaU1.Bin034]|nr:MAG: Tetraacyldisaccharide 4'-kinase [Syntrophorhabdaceae bacterium PtaU1.Bin034]
MGSLMVRVWRGEAPLLRACLFLPLFILSAVYRFALVIRRALYATGLLSVWRAPIPVVSVGNLSMGGTGKTVVVERLSGILKQRGFRPAIVLRGYRRKRKGAFAVDPNSDTAESAGDEAVMLSRRVSVPVIVGSKRREAIEKGIREFGIDMAVFDDGYQVRNVHKDLDMVILNGSEPEESRHVFPLGFLREPLEMIRRADIILVNKGELDARMRTVTTGIPTFRVRYRPLCLKRLNDGKVSDHNSIRRKRVAAFSGLGDNRSFFNLLRDMGADVVRTVEFPDHYRYSANDVAYLRSFADAEMIVTTEKDAVKLDRMEVGDKMFCLLIEAEIDNEEAFIEIALNKTRG